MRQLGRGKAYYDNFLHLYTSSRQPPLLGKFSACPLSCKDLMCIVALALSPQILPPGQEVPMTSTDFQLNGVLSPSGMIWREGPPKDS
jgi:5-formyltetrahydrofolate cyclo-ligase